MSADAGSSFGAACGRAARMLPAFLLLAGGCSWSVWRDDRTFDYTRLAMVAAFRDPTDARAILVKLEGPAPDRLRELVPGVAETQWLAVRVPIEPGQILEDPFAHRDLWLLHLPGEPPNWCVGEPAHPRKLMPPTTPLWSQCSVASRAAPQELGEPLVDKQMFEVIVHDDGTRTVWRVLLTPPAAAMDGVALGVGAAACVVAGAMFVVFAPIAALVELDREFSRR